MFTVTDRKSPTFQIFLQHCLNTFWTFSTCSHRCTRTSVVPVLKWHVVRYPTPHHHHPITKDNVVLHLSIQTPLLYRLTFVVYCQKICGSTEADSVEEIYRIIWTTGFALTSALRRYGIHIPHNINGHKRALSTPAAKEHCWCLAKKNGMTKL